MPKKFTEAEKEYIVKRLKEEAMKCLVTYGVKKTTVDELVKRVNIPKGTFYLFYPSKELLLYDAINDLHEEMHEQFLNEISKFKNGFHAEDLAELLFRLYKQFDETGLMPIVMNGDLDYLIRKLPEDVVKEHLSYDDFSVKQLFSFLSLEEKDITLISGGLRAVFLTLLFKREIGEQIYDDVIRMMIKGIVLQFLD
ncbi:TetR/AcrR family transcriptional regulator [Mobilitalea sibirica]|uniref:TetR/AcrR family transcriptional regulator n=1 Tax=Mobilitalea sibirica TaxID=1462919 RepID=A0A8J7H4G1_9FIRM|nr:TetR/AcrR family transcriptional regulator [Mobilitalea sibirica]MBH1942328.1 TetR/AcrR family transcriptional regulator [Mobilitalea sibirica]